MGNLDVPAATTGINRQPGGSAEFSGRGSQAKNRDGTRSTSVSTMRYVKSLQGYPTTMKTFSDNSMIVKSPFPIEACQSGRRMAEGVSEEPPFVERVALNGMEKIEPPRFRPWPKA